MSNKNELILVIDDDLASLTTIQSILERANYQVSLAKNAGIARRILDTTNIGLILLDMEMPEVSGIDFLETLRNEPALYHIPVIIVSSHGTADVIINANKTGANDFVVKPVSPEILLEKISSVLSTARKVISPLLLVRKLNLLASFCTTGQSGSVERLIKELELYCCDLETDYMVAEICKGAREMDYLLVEEKVKQLKSNLALS